MYGGSMVAVVVPDEKLCPCTLLLLIILLLRIKF